MSLLPHVYCSHWSYVYCSFGICLLHRDDSFAIIFWYMSTVVIDLVSTTILVPVYCRFGFYLLQFGPIIRFYYIFLVTLLQCGTMAYGCTPYNR